MMERKKPFPSLLIKLALLALIAAIAYFVCYLPTDESVLAAYEWYGKFVCDNDIVFIVLALVKVGAFGYRRNRNGKHGY